MPVDVDATPESRNEPVTVGKQHDAYLDVLKGFAISLVVLGHSIQTFVAKYDDNIVFRVIYSFHMPLFMFLAGAVAAHNTRPMDRKFLRRKFSQLVVPFAAWYLVAYLLTDAHRTVAFGRYLQKGVESPDNGLWFLPVLFLNFCCLALAKWLSGRFNLFRGRLHVFSYLLVWLAIYLLPTGKFGIGLVKWHLPFFMAGYLVIRHGPSLARYRKVVFCLCAAAFPLLAASWHRLYYPSFVRRLAAHLETYSMHLVSTAGPIVHQIAVGTYAYVVPLTGIGFFYGLFRLRPFKYVYALLGFIGIYTLDIYASQMYFFRLAVGESWLQIATGFIAALVMSLLLGIWVLRRVPILDKVFLGGRAGTGISLKAHRAQSRSSVSPRPPALR